MMATQTHQPLLSLLLLLISITQINAGNLRASRIPSPEPQPMSERQLERHLPLFAEKGGLIVFLHVAKTGGTTIRHNFADLPNVYGKRAFHRRQLERSSKEIEWYVSEKNNLEANDQEQTMLLELHGSHGEPMTIFEIHPYLQKWRTQAKANNKQVFVFTLVRDPVSFYVSHFNFFKRPGCTDPWCDQPVEALTEENLLASAVPNHQCEYLARTYNKEENSAFPVSKEECQSVMQLLKADLDWIGTTGSMQESTLPLLSYIMTGNSATGRSMEVKNQQKRPNALSQKSLSEDARQQLATMSTLDQELYDMASQYSFDMFENYNSIQSQ